MAREQRKDVDYFPHDCDRSMQIHIIESRYDNDGYAVFYKLFEQLGKAKNHYINIGDEMTLMFLISNFKVSEEKALLILKDMAKLNVIDRELYEDYKVIWSEKFTESIVDAYRLRKNKLYKREHVLLAINGQSSEETPQSPEDWTENSKKTQKSAQSSEVIRKEKERIVKDSKGKESKEERESKNQRFSPPSLIEVEEFFASKINETFWSDDECKKEAKKFVSFYDSKNWFVGKNKMSKWKSAASGWITRKEDFNQQKNGNKNNGNDSDGTQNGDKDFGQL